MPMVSHLMCPNDFLKAGPWQASALQVLAVAPADTFFHHPSAARTSKDLLR